MFRPLPLRPLATVVLLALIGGCVRSDKRYYGTTEPRHPPNVLWTNLGTEPEWIDPNKCSESAGSTIVFNVFEGLTQPHPQTLEPMPAIATHWDVSEDGVTYTFHLRQSNWSDGHPLTAHDFEYSWKRLLDRDTASKYASFLYPLRYAEPFHQKAVLLRGLPEATTREQVEALVKPLGDVASVRLAPELKAAFIFVGGEEADRDANRESLLEALQRARLDGAKLRAEVTPKSLVGVKATDDYTLQATLENPLPYFLQLVNFYSAMPVPRHVIERLEREHINTDLWTRLEYIVTNGPYVIAEWKFRQYYILEKNPEYWDPASVKMPKIRFVLVDSYNTTLNLYEAGELDYIGDNSVLPNEFMDHLGGFEDFRRGPFLASYFYWLNTKAKPFDDVRVRQAFKLAVDRKAIVEKVTRAGQIPSADVVPDGVGGYEGLKSPVYDPEQAKQLLAEAGYPGGKGLPEITLIYNTSEGHKQIAEAVQSMWKENLGVLINIENQEWKVYLKRLQATDFQIARMGWIGDYADPFTFLELLMPENGNNHSNWHDAKFKRLLEQANRTLDPQARFALIREAEQHAMDATPVIPFYTYTRSEMIKPYVRDSFMNYQNRMLYKYIYIDERYYDGVPEQPLKDDPPPRPGAMP